MSAGVVTLTGPPGSGKSTAGRLAAERLHLEYVSAGAIFREEAQRRGLDLSAFSRYAEAHDEVDRKLDDRILAQASPQRFLDGRVTGALLRRRGTPTIYLVVTADEEVRVARVATRDRQPLAEARRQLRLREESESDRYRRYYGIDLRSEPADLVVDSTSLPPAAVAGRLVEFVEARRAHTAS